LLQSITLIDPVLQLVKSSSSLTRLNPTALQNLKLQADQFILGASQRSTQDNAGSHCRLRFRFNSRYHDGFQGYPTKGKCFNAVCNLRDSNPSTLTSVFDHIQYFGRLKWMTLWNPHISWSRVGRVTQGFTGYTGQDAALGGSDSWCAIAQLLRDQAASPISPLPVSLGRNLPHRDSQPPLCPQ
jgi:hypothetical protein